ncbi:MAG TPA: peptide chain release factor N(5)-glutamine methyltransferase [Dehalococcoidia bacterium]|nr:peptide chain release factor N(5)-glutamine methyltransferase [Dehalococcoidia bacterium]
MTLKTALRRARDTLAGSGIEDAPLEGELLLKYALNISRTRLYTELERELSPREEETLWRLVERRRNGEPTAYITTSREFYGLDFYVDPRVLIPRPESELLVEAALKLAQNRHLSAIADIGTGCVAIAVSLALELPEAKIYATDISAPALEVAGINCRKHGVADRVHLLQGDMLTPIPEPVELIVANLPYVEKSELTPLRFEPRLALDGGAEGTERIGQLCRQVGAGLKSGGCLLLEIGQGQENAVTSFLRRFFPEGEIEVAPDLSGIERVISLSLTSSQARVAR